MDFIILPRLTVCLEVPLQKVAAKPQIQICCNPENSSTLSLNLDFCLRNVQTPFHTAICVLCELLQFRFHAKRRGAVHGVHSHVRLFLCTGQLADRADRQFCELYDCGGRISFALH